MTSLLTTPAVKTIDLPTGVTLQYAEQGDPAGPPILLLHGITDSWHSFEPLLPYLPASLRVFSLTQRGHGDASRPATGYRPSDMAADVVAFLDALGIATAVVAGHSMGSGVAQRVAIDVPERVRGIALLGSFVLYRDNPGLVAFCEEAIWPLDDPIDPALAREFQESTLARPIAPSLLDLYVRESLKVPARVWREAFAGLLALDESYYDELASISAPALVLWGDQDAFTPRANQDTLLALIPSARLVVYAGAGHALHWEEPARAAADLAAFVAGLAG